jgi:hypothetical protein
MSTTDLTPRQAKAFAAAQLATSLVAPFITYAQARHDPVALARQARRLPLTASLAGLTAYATTRRPSSTSADSHQLTHTNADPCYIALNIAGAAAAALIVSRLVAAPPLSRRAALRLAAARAAFTAPALLYALYRAYPPAPLLVPWAEPIPEVALPDPDDS